MIVSLFTMLVYKFGRLFYLSNNVVLFALFISFTTKSFAQDVTTTFHDSHWTENTDERVALYQVRLQDRFTLVTIKFQPKKNKKRQRYWWSNQTYIRAGNAKLPLLGAEKDGAYHSCTYYDNWGWNDVTEGETLYVTLIFSGRIPEGITTFSLIDEASSGSGYGFTNYTINNPKTHSIPDEGYCRFNIDNNNDGICGIYEEIAGNKYRLACIKMDGLYYLVYLGCKDSPTWWFIGDLQATLEESATYGVFKAKWVLKNKIYTDEAYVFFDGTVMKSYLPNERPEEYTYMKMYPTATSGSIIGDNHVDKNSEWSGTGFALMNNYIVTNYHVVENAKTIQIQGVNGNYNKKFNATIVATDKNNDLAILKVSGCTISSVGIPYSIKTSTSEVGEEVFVLGYPLTTTMGEEIKLTTGVVSSRTGFQGDVSQYQISAPIQPGNSGGPLFDGKGNVIGIVSAKHRGAENVGYAIKTSYLKNLMESVISSNILPQNNKISSFALSEKVKTVKKYIYYITCSSNSNESSVNDSSHSSTSGKTYNNPIVNINRNEDLKVVSVSVQDTQTLLTLACNNREREVVSSISIDKNAYIVANNQRYTLNRARGIAVYPNHTYFSYVGETKTFTLYFPAIPKNSSSIDFVESVDNGWKIYGIQLR